VPAIDVTNTSQLLAKK